jgi:hypothetical protein
MNPQLRREINAQLVKGQRYEQIATDCAEEARNSTDPFLKWAARMWARDAELCYARAAQIRRQAKSAEE